MINNHKIAEIFLQMADILDIKGDNVFKINAFRRGAQIVENFPREFSDAYNENPENLNNVAGLGEGLKSKIIELITTGNLNEFNDILKNFDTGLLEMLKIRGVGPKKVKLFYEKLGINSVEKLKKACEKQEIQKLPKMGERSETEILNAIQEISTFSNNRYLINSALEDAENLISFLKNCSEIKQIQYAGSLRRFKESIGDIDIISTSKNKNSEQIMNYFLEYPQIFKVLSKGDTKSSVILLSGIQVDLRVVDNNSFGSALHYFTGNKEHNIKIREIAKSKGLKINEYGVFKDEKRISGEQEEDIFKAVDLPFIPPEIRRNDGEIEYAIKHKSFPKFVDLKDIIGDLHMHSDFSDGRFSMEEMANEAIKRGYKYIGFADHSDFLKITNGMDENKIKKQWLQIDKLNKKLLNKIHIFKSCEVDILKNGSLNMPDHILKELDYTICSVHIRYSELDREKQTKRILKALSNPFVKILAHPTGRKINSRPELDIDMELIIKACVDKNILLEINSSPQRLDLYDKYILMAKNLGAKFVINSDAHFPFDFENLKFGVGMARRGWLEVDNIINTLPLDKIKSILKKI